VDGVFPLDQPLDDQEMIAWRMSVNYNREKHPLIQENRKRKLKRSRLSNVREESNGVHIGNSVGAEATEKCRKAVSFPITLAEPDTVHISILESHRDITTGKN
jgi:hypothetical protein